MAIQTLPPSERYAALFGETLDQLPGGGRERIKRARQASFARFQELGFPGPKVEAWKYSSAAPLAKLAVEQAPAPVVERAAIAPYLVSDAAATRLVFVNGRFAAGLSDALPADGALRLATLADELEVGEHELPPLLAEADSERSLNALNAAFASDGCVLRLAEGAVAPGPVQLLFFATGRQAGALVNLRNLVQLRAGAKLTLLETHVVDGEAAPLTNLVTRIELGEGAELHHDRLQLGSIAGSFVGRNELRLGARARLRQSLATLGGGFVRNEVDAVLDGSAIAATFNGLYLTRDGQHIDNALRIEHAKPNSVSDQFYKGMLDGQAKAAFAGKIIVRRPAQKTAAYQANNNLLLSPDAEINTKPELEIYADDVKCSHGATAGELDEHALFYLRSRGLDPATARAMLTFAFADEVLERFAHAEIAAQARQELLRWLPGGQALSEML